MNCSFQQEWEFGVEIESGSTDQQIDKWEHSYSKRKRPIQVDFRCLVPGTCTENLTHLIHPYPAKLLPHIPIFFLDSKLLRNGLEKPIVADPFCGSGTVILEAATRGFGVVGSDTNPLARLITEVKVNPQRASILRRSLRRVISRAANVSSPSLPNVINRKYWYTQGIASELGRIKGAIDTIRNKETKSFMNLCLSVCCRRMSFADPRVSVPVRINPKRKKKYGTHFPQLEKHLKSLKPKTVIKTFVEIAVKNISRISSLEKKIQNRPSLTLVEDVFSLPSQIGLETVDLVITSPPYLGAQKYIRSSSLSIGWLALSPNGELRPLERKTIGREHLDQDEGERHLSISIPRANAIIRKVAKTNPLRARIASTYLTEMSKALVAIASVLKEGGTVIMVVGPNTLCGLHFDTPKYVEHLANNAGLQTRFVLIDHIRSRGLMTKRNKTAALISSEAVLVLRKTHAKR